MENKPKTALLVIDPQLDYFPGYKFPLWNTAAVLENIVAAIRKCRQYDMPVILVRHLADRANGLAPFFVKGTLGAEIHPQIREAAPEAPVVEKAFADGFVKTGLEATLRQLGVEKLLLCGMMTQNCVTHTAISPMAEKYRPVILGDCCTTVSEMLHLIALNAVSTRVALQTAAEAIN
ncbi:cysteine hydrolase family protein [Victivallis sp. Marseille-Q1083]|uniref:cysteine hydrolase family protein n=1 Tax=Victivallis sp. Marseille-Q1083 TaxID=2717288 RepID=UPI001589E0C2|nr:cysteine hydrolase family protein [Victivallis sp. Marseille-Q1083]